MRPIELDVISNVISNTAKPKLIAKDDRIKKIFDLDNIQVEEYIDSRNGKHIKKYSTINLNDAYYKIDKPYNELKELVFNRSIPVLGLMYKSKKYS